MLPRSLNVSNTLINTELEPTRKRYRRCVHVFAIHGDFSQRWPGARKAEARRREWPQLLHVKARYPRSCRNQQMQRRFDTTAQLKDLTERIFVDQRTNPDSTCAHTVGKDRETRNCSYQASSVVKSSIPSVSVLTTVRSHLTPCLIVLEHMPST